MAVVVSLGVLFRGGAERQIREQLIQENLVDAAISLAPKMFPHTSIQVAISVVRKTKPDEKALFIDASSSFQHGKPQNILGRKDQDLFETTYRSGHDVNRYARLVTRTEIAANDWNLSVACYVDATENEADVDLTELRAEHIRLKTQQASLEATLAALLKEIDYD